jgi:hypothetical protein
VATDTNLSATVMIPESGEKIACPKGQDAQKQR